MDPFFQYIKSSKKARETLIGPHKEFSVNSVIAIALRQNTGVDKAMSGSGKRIVRKENKNSSEFVGISKDLYKFEDVNDYFSQAQKPKESDYKNYDTLENLRLKKGYPFKKHPRAIRQSSVEVDINDIHYRNTELLSQYLTPVGLIKQRNVTRLPKNVHNRIRRAIKHSRHMYLLPSASYVKPEHRLSLRSLAEDISQDMNMQVDLQSGAVQIAPNDSKYEYKRDHYSISIDQHSLYHEDPEGDDLNSPFVQRMIFKHRTSGIDDKELREVSEFDKAVLYTKNKKRKELRRNGVDVDEMLKGRSSRVMASNLTDAPLDRLDENFFEETPTFRESYESMGYHFRNSNEVDLLDYLVAESVHDINSLSDMAEMADEISDNQEELDNLPYDYILKKIDNIKKLIPNKQNVSNMNDTDSKQNETTYQNWNNVNTEKEFLGRLKLLD